MQRQQHHKQLICSSKSSCHHYKGVTFLVITKFSSEIFWNREFLLGHLFGSCFAVYKEFCKNAILSCIQYPLSSTDDGCEYCTSAITTSPSIGGFTCNYARPMLVPPQMQMEIAAATQSPRTSSISTTMITSDVRF